MVLLRLPDVMARTGLSRSTVYLRMEEGNFPRIVKLGGRAAGWVESEVEEWMERMVKKRDEGVMDVE